MQTINFQCVIFISNISFVGTLMVEALYFKITRIVNSNNYKNLIYQHYPGFTLYEDVR